MATDDEDSKSTKLVNFVRVDKISKIFKAISLRNRTAAFHTIFKHSELVKLKAEKELLEEKKIALNISLKKLELELREQRQDALITEKRTAIMLMSKMVRIKVGQAFNTIRNVPKRSLKGLVSIFRTKETMIKHSAFNLLLSESMSKFSREKKKIEEFGLTLNKDTRVQLDILNDAVNHLKVEKAELESDKDKLRLKVQNLVDIVNKLKLELGESRSESENLKNEQQNNLKSFKLYTANIDHIKNSFTSIVASNNELVKLTQEDKILIGKLKKEIDVKEDELDKLQTKYERLDKKTEELKDSKQTKDESLSKMKDKLNQMILVNSELNIEIKVQTTKCSRTSEENNSLLSRLAIAENQINQLRNQLDNKTEDLEELEKNKLGPLNSKLEALYSENEELINDVAAKTQTISKQKQDLDTSLAKLNELENTIHRLNKEKIDFYKQISHLADMYNQMKADNIQLTKIVEQHKNDAFNKKLIDKEPIKLEAQSHIMNKNIFTDDKDLDLKRDLNMMKNSKRSSFRQIIEEDESNVMTGARREDTPILNVNESRRTSKGNIKERLSDDIKEPVVNEMGGENMAKKISEIKQKYNIKI